MSRLRRFAKDLPPRSDARGRPLLADRHMRYIGVDLVCVRCGQLLARFEVDSRHEAFDPAQVSERLPNSAVIERMCIEEQDGSTRVRYKLLCSRCRHSPVIRAERIDRILAEHYERNAFDKVVKLRI